LEEKEEKEEEEEEEEEEKQAQKICEDCIVSGYQNVENVVDLVHSYCPSLQHKKKRRGTIIEGLLHLTLTSKH
jgi:hypothetical protein